MQNGNVRLCLAALPMALSSATPRRTLKPGEHRYWTLAIRCLRIARRRGRGGAVRRVLPEAGAAAETDAEAHR